MKNIAKILLVNIFSLHSVFAQDVHFSQFYLSPQTLNPSETGNFDGDLRVSNIYRMQWDAFGIPFNTLSIGADAPFDIRKHRLSAGLAIITDNSGDAKLKVNKFMFSIAYHKKSGIHVINAGLQGGYISKTISLDRLTFPNQYNYGSGIFDSALPHNENGLGDKLSYVDLNAGIGWTARYKTFYPFLKLALFHINRPNESFLTTKNRLPIKTVFSGGGRFNIGSRYFIIPNVLYMNYAHASDMMLGFNFGYYFASEQIKSVYIGPYYRGDAITTTDAAAISIGINLKNFDIQICYDVNISRLSEYTNHRGAIEIAIIYTTESTKVYKTSIPCERY
ncbi:MAG: PorP/SprF family type IX secretion system membrane protein [Bacteroidia bacterium]|nr:PorP/SprF family type IX secretion system membrane protein [Bacteroidia bacterium]